MSAPRKTAFIKTYGCQMNVYDSERIADALEADGYTMVETPEAADVTVLNTCHIREKAAEKVYSEIGRLRMVRNDRRAAGQDMKIAIAGCVAQAEGREMIRRAPDIDAVVGPQAFQDLPKMLKSNATKVADKPVQQDFLPDEKFRALTKSSRKAPPAAFLTIQEGCDKFCTFCVVPYTRGAEYSRPAEELVIEAEQLVERGARDITVLGQNVNAYHGVGPKGTTWSLADLLYRLGEIPGLARLRYTTSHPRDMDDALIKAHGEIDVLMPYLHLPVQSGSDTILKSMNRRHDRELYFDIIARLRAARPDIALSSDLIVGFPGESDQDFEDTIDLVRQVTYAQCYSFKYSSRSGTPGAEMEDQVPEEVKTERLAVLQALLNDQQREFNAAMVGKEMPVLLERVGKQAGQMIGRSPYMQSVHLQTDTQIGQMLDCKILSAGPNSLAAQALV